MASFLSLPSLLYMNIGIYSSLGSLLSNVIRCTTMNFTTYAIPPFDGLLVCWFVGLLVFWFFVLYVRVSWVWIVIFIM